MDGTDVVKQAQALSGCAEAVHEIRVRHKHARRAHQLARVSLWDQQAHLPR
jgi:hypothetical protein